MAKAASRDADRPDCLGIISSRGMLGFTLVELLVTIGVIILVAIAGAGTFFLVDGWRAHNGLKAAARELFLHMHKARTEAVVENRKWAIVFETGAHSRYHICSSSGDGSWSSLNDNTIVQTVDLKEYDYAISFGAGGATKTATSPSSAFAAGFDFVSFNHNVVIFSPTGLPASSGYCYLSNDRNESYAVGALTSGVIRVKRWDHNAWE